MRRDEMGRLQEPDAHRALSSCLGYSSFRARQTVTRWHRSGSGGVFGDLIPYLESGGEVGAVGGGGHAVSWWAEVWGDTTERGEEPLRRADAAEPFHGVFALPGRLMGVLAPIVQILVLPVFRCRHRGPVCDLVAAKRVGDQHPRSTALLRQDFLDTPIDIRQA